MKTTWKKALCLALAASLGMISLSGCGKKTGAGGDDYEIVWCYPSTSVNNDIASVEAKINEYIQPKIGATLKLMEMDWGTYEQKMNNMAAAGDKYDICFTANWLFNYGSLKSKGAFMDITEYVQNAPGITGEVAMEELQQLGKDDKVYGIPVIKDFAYSYGFLFNKALAEKYQVDLNSINGYEDLIPYLEQIKANEPEILPLYLGRGKSPASLVLYENIGFPMGLRIDKKIGELVNIIEEEDMQNAYKLARELYLAGYTENKNVASDDYNKMMKEGKIFCTLETCKPGKGAEMSNEKVKYLQKDITAPIQDLGGMQGAVMAIAATCQNPEKVVKFIELLYTDATLNNLIVYGVEGKHYNKSSETVVEPIEGSGYGYASAKWMFGNTKLHYLLPTEDADKNEQLAAFNASAVKTPYWDLSIDDKVANSVKVERAACSSIREEYEANLETGKIDPETAIPEYLEKLEKSGALKIREAYGPIVEEWAK